MIKVPQPAQKKMKMITIDDVVKDLLFSKECISRTEITNELKKKWPKRNISDVTLAGAIYKLREKGNIIVVDTYYKIL